MDTTQFWEARAQKYAGDGAGLKAVCSYAMPAFYNWAIDFTQRAALRGVIGTIAPGARVLDYGCGIGRWTREIAGRGAAVTAVDFSRTMLLEAARRSETAGLADRCRFVQADVTSLELTERFDVVFGVTVLQHVLDDGCLAETIARLARHLVPGGRLILVEAAPTQGRESCETKTFRARTQANYVAKIQAAGLKVVLVRGVDPSPLKLWVVPKFKTWPRLLSVPALWIATLASLPLDLCLARLLTRYSWHKIVVAVADGSPP